MNIKQALSWANGELKNSCYRDNSYSTASLLLASILQMSKTRLLLVEDDLVSEINLKTYHSHIARATQDEPLEYITNTASFYSRDFFVNQHTLIPRPETEILIDTIVQNIDKPTLKSTFCEIGTGTGIISITLALEYPQSHFIATDISSQALEVARQNAKIHNCQNITFTHTNLLDNINTPIDILISNPPYIKNTEILEKNVASYEPHLALFGGEEGTELLFAIVDLAFARGVQMLFCEMGYDQKEVVREYVQANYACERLEFYEDLARLDRGFWLKIH